MSAAPERAGSKVAEWLYVVDVQVDQAIESAWNDWYTDTHLPEIASCPGFLSANRYVSEDSDGNNHYLTVYELTGPEALKSPEFTERRGWSTFVDKLQFRSALYRWMAGT